MDDKPYALEEMRAAIAQLRAEFADLRDDLDHHLLMCPEPLPGVAEMTP